MNDLIDALLGALSGSDVTSGDRDTPWWRVAVYILLGFGVIGFGIWWFMR